MGVDLLHWLGANNLLVWMQEILRTSHLSSTASPTTLKLSSKARLLNVCITAVVRYRYNPTLLMKYVQILF